MESLYFLQYLTRFVHIALERPQVSSSFVSVDVTIHHTQFFQIRGATGNPFRTE